MRKLVMCLYVMLALCASASTVNAQGEGPPDDIDCGACAGEHAIANRCVLGCEESGSGDCGWCYEWWSQNECIYFPDNDCQGGFAVYLDGRARIPQSASAVTVAMASPSGFARRPCDQVIIHRYFTDEQTRIARARAVQIDIA